MTWQITLNCSSTSPSVLQPHHATEICAPLPSTAAALHDWFCGNGAWSPSASMRLSNGAWRQGHTLVHFSAQRKRFLWHRGCIQGLFTGCLGGLRDISRGCLVPGPLGLNL